MLVANNPVVRPVDIIVGMYNYTTTELCEPKMNLYQTVASQTTTHTIAVKTAAPEPSEEEFSRLVPSANDYVGTGLVALNQQTRVATVLSHLGGVHCPQYEDIFGVISEQAPWGNNLWSGLRSCFINLRQKPYKGGPAHFSGCCFKIGWFACPLEFSKQNARRSMTEAPAIRWYPAVFCMCEGCDDPYMWCLAQILRAWPYWVVHPGRVHMLCDL